MIGQIFSYTLSSSIVLAVLYLGYKWCMARRCPLWYDRLALLGIYVISLLFFPLTGQLKYLEVAKETGVIDVNFDFTAAAVAANGETSVSYIIMSIALAIWIIGMAVVAAGWIGAYFRLHSLIKRGEKREAGEWTLVVTDDNTLAPFSWKYYIILSRNDYESGDETLGALLTHEGRHLASCHWIDLMLAQAVCVVQWFNPASWLMREELRAVHEYEADEAVMREGFDARRYQMMLIKRAVGKRFPSVANSFNHSKLKNRITMMCKKKPSPRSLWRGLALVPALGAALLVADIPAVATTLRDASDAGFPVAAAVSESKVSENGATSQEEKIHTAVETLPEYPGGMTAMMDFMGKNVKYPEEAQKEKIEGRVVVKFVVEADGRIGDATVVKGVHPSLDKEAVRVVKSMPKWIPGKVDGKPVACYFNLPVSFKLD